MSAIAFDLVVADTPAPWLSESVRDKWAFRIEQWSDLTGYMKR